jgi:hypothetical protein
MFGKLKIPILTRVVAGGKSLNCVDKRVAEIRKILESFCFMYTVRFTKVY